MRKRHSRRQSGGIAEINMTPLTSPVVVWGWTVSTGDIRLSTPLSAQPHFRDSFNFQIEKINMYDYLQLTDNITKILNYLKLIDNATKMRNYLKITDSSHFRRLRF
mgnify:CR=1 FL=1